LNFFFLNFLESVSLYHQQRPSIISQPICVVVCVCVLGWSGGVQTVGGYVGEVRGWYHYYTVIELSLIAPGALLV